MLNVSKKRLAAAVAFGGSLFLLDVGANAATLVSIGVDTGVGPPTLVASGATAATYTANFGNFSFNIDTGTSGLSFFNSSTTNNASSSGVADIYVTIQGLPAGFYNFTSAFTINQGTFNSITESTYWDGANNVFSTANLLDSLASLSGAQAAKTSSSGSFLVPTTLSLTELFTIDMNAGGNDLSTIHMTWSFERFNQPTPLPAALPLFASVIGGGGLLARWRKKRTSKMAAA